MFSIENLIAEIEPLLPEKYNLESREKKHLLQFSDYQGSDAKLKTFDVSIESSSTSVGLLIEILMEEIKLAVAEKSEFEYRDNAISLALFRISGKSEL